MLTRIVAAAAVTLTCSTAFAGPAAADPSPRIDTTATAVVLSGFGPGGFSRAEDGSIRVTMDGESVARLPAHYTLDGVTHRIDAGITEDGGTLTLTPELATRPVASTLENQMALSDFATTMKRGPLIGSIVGAVVGAVIGIAVGASTCLVVGPACLATIPVALAAFAGAGGIAGTVLVGGGALAVGLWDYLTVLGAPPGHSRYAGTPELADPHGAGVPNPPLQLPSGSAKGLNSGSSSGTGN
ncbi:hypothetical protein [Nocardia vermiculata]|uniref:DUF8020 domain-containing protein n=1 Tax=Nocardia vermiculata TaxID=257274 RepID=A0A846XX55_9NOCA|nr:hypothetical protein [Nocardia vermiculata]NKY48769.1 hypothetical protein [Nocardia vermiculata]